MPFGLGALFLLTAYLGRIRGFESSIDASDFETRALPSSLSIIQISWAAHCLVVIKSANYYEFLPGNRLA